MTQCLLGSSSRSTIMLGRGGKKKERRERQERAKKERERGEFVRVSERASVRKYTQFTVGGRIR